MNHDALFIRFVTGIFTIMVLYGIGMMAAVIFGDASLASRMVSGFGTMFAGVLGLGSGYLLGATSRALQNGHGDEPADG